MPTLSVARRTGYVPSRLSMNADSPRNGRNISKYLSDAIVRNSFPDPVNYISERCGTIHGRGRVDILMGAHDTLDADRHFAGRCMTDGDKSIFLKLGRAFENLNLTSCSHWGPAGGIFTQHGACVGAPIVDARPKLFKARRRKT